LWEAGLSAGRVVNRGRRHVLIVIGALIVSACAAPTDPPGTSATATSSSRASIDRIGSAPAILSPAAADGPPVALLAAEGGDPVAGQLGTYTWKETGSDAPWLPGARIAIGMGEPLSVGVVGETPAGAWVARARPSGTSLPARQLGDGSGIVEFGAPAAGIWSVAVEIHFADGSGVATYFWELHIG
jgi:hypothetical protein